MLLAHAVTLGQARSYVAALADAAVTADASIEYDRVLLQIDFIHGDYIPGISPVPGHRPRRPVRGRRVGHRRARRARHRLSDRRARPRHAVGRPRTGCALMYGETSGMLRDALGELLRQHRIQQRIGGAGIHTVPETTTVEERKTIGQQIARYRYAVLVWCHQAMHAANPRIGLEGSSGRARGPAEGLRYRLERTLRGMAVDLPTLDELVTPQQFALVESWRQAARASALGEHDFANGVGYGRLSEPQCLTVIKDAADVARALVSLDRRYANIPGWQALPEPGRLGRAAATCATWAGHGEPDYTVDRRGWKPAPNLIEGPGLPGSRRGHPSPAQPAHPPRPLPHRPEPARRTRLPTQRLPRGRPTPRTDRPSPRRPMASNAVQPTAVSSERPVTSAACSAEVEPPPDRDRSQPHA